MFFFMTKRILEKGMEWKGPLECVDTYIYNISIQPPFYLDPCFDRNWTALSVRNCGTLQPTALRNKNFHVLQSLDGFFHLHLDGIYIFIYKATPLSIYIPPPNPNLKWQKLSNFLRLIWATHQVLQNCQLLWANSWNSLHKVHRAWSCMPN